MKLISGMARGLADTPVEALKKQTICENGKLYRFHQFHEMETKTGQRYLRFDFVADDGGVWMEYAFIVAE